MTACPCMGCEKRTIEPNCHEPARCEAWKAYCEAKENERRARQEAALLDGANNLRMVKSKTKLGWTYVLGDKGGRRHSESKKRRMPGGSAHVQR